MKKLLALAIMAVSFGVQSAGDNGLRLNPCIRIKKITIGGPAGMITELEWIPGCVVPKVQPTYPAKTLPKKTHKEPLPNYIKPIDPDATCRQCPINGEM
jgi:hypothetical protein